MEGDCGVTDESSFPRSTWKGELGWQHHTAQDTSWQSFPAPAYPAHEAESPFQVSWACLVGLLHSLLNLLNGRGEIISFYPATHLQDPSL